MHKPLMQSNDTHLRRLLACLFIAASLLLGGCASIIRSEVTVFHEWPDAAGERSYAFAQLPGDENNLELHSYQSLVREQLAKLGFVEAASASAQYKVAMEYSIEMREKRVLEAVAIDPFYSGRIGFYGPGRGMFYDPFWYGPTPVVERTVDVYSRRLRLPISCMNDGRMVYDVTVTSEGATPSLATIMPFMVRSAFDDFPGKSGTARFVELKTK
ncbi:MAG: DUF4136 domain-containing protein [Janthinobacterium lividum]